MLPSILGLSQKSCNVIVCKYLKVPAPKNLLVERHLKPLAKKLNVKTKSKDKNWMIIDIAKELLRRKQVVLDCSSYRDVLPENVRC